MMGKSGERAFQAEKIVGAKIRTDGCLVRPRNSKEAGVAGDGVRKWEGHWVSQLL